MSGGEKRDPEPTANTLGISPNQDQTADPSGPGPSDDSADPEGTTPEQEAKQESEERVRGLLKAYQEVLEAVEELPAVVWVTWDRKGRSYRTPCATKASVRPSKPQRRSGALPLRFLRTHADIMERPETRRRSPGGITYRPG